MKNLVKCLSFALCTFAFFINGTITKSFADNHSTTTKIFTYSQEIKTARKSFKPWIKDRKFVSIDPTILAASENIIFNLSSDYTGVRTALSQIGNKNFYSRYTLYDKEKEVGTASINLLLKGKRSVVSGQISAGDKNFVLLTEKRQVILQENDTSKFKKQKLPDNIHNSRADNLAIAAAYDATAIDGQEIATVNIIVAYTETAALNAKSIRQDVPTLINKIIIDTNLYFKQSKAKVNLNLVASYMVPKSEYNEEAISGSLLDRLGHLSSTSNTYFSNLRKLRNEKGADLVSLITEKADSKYCGFANIAGPYSVVARNCFFLGDPEAFSRLFAHEIGHNFGAGHEPGNGNGYNSDSHGHRFTDSLGQQFRDIMAYPPGTQLPYFSNPDLTYNGAPLGIPNLSNNVSTINILRRKIASILHFGPVQVDKTEWPIIYANEGQAISLYECAATGSMPITYQWIKDGKVINEMTLESSTSSIDFRPLKLSDTGDYYCKATNKYGSDMSATRKLVVRAGATLTPTRTPTPSATPTPAKLSTYFDAEPNDIVADAGSLVILACEIYSMSKPYITLESFDGTSWKKITADQRRSIFYSYRVKPGMEIVRCSAQDLSGTYADVTGRRATIQGNTPATLTPTPTKTSVPTMTRTATPTATKTATVTPTASSALCTTCWKNPKNRFDVDNNRRLNADDSLTIIAKINQVGSIALPQPTPGFSPPPYYDVNGDGRISATDALNVVNNLNLILSQNSANRYDVNGDGNVSVTDALTIVNILNGTSSTTRRYADVNGDGSVSEDDSAAVINFLNSKK